MTAAETVWINIISSPAGLEVQPLVCFNEPISPRSADKFSSKVHSDDKYPKRPLHHLAQRRLTFTAESQKSLCTLPCLAEHTHTTPFSRRALDSCLSTEQCTAQAAALHIAASRGTPHDTQLRKPESSFSDWMLRAGFVRLMSGYTFPSCEILQATNLHAFWTSPIKQNRLLESFR